MVESGADWMNADNGNRQETGEGRGPTKKTKMAV